MKTSCTSLHRRSLQTRPPRVHSGSLRRVLLRYSSQSHTYSQSILIPTGQYPEGEGDPFGNRSTSPTVGVLRLETVCSRSDLKYSIISSLFIKTLVANECMTSTRSGS